MAQSMAESVTQSPVTPLSLIKKKDETAHPALILLLILIVTTIASNLIPSGVYERVVINGKTVVNPASFQYIEKINAGVEVFFKSFYHGFVSGAGLSILMLFVGAAFFGVAKDIGIMELCLKSIYQRIKNLHFAIFVFIFLLAYGLLISFTGMFDLGAVFIPMIIPLCLAMGYDAMTGAAIILVASCVGYGSAMANPFFTANAHLIAELPIYSAAWFRGTCFLTLLVPCTFFIVRYAKRVKRNPAASLTNDLALNYEPVNDDPVRFTSAQLRATVVFFSGLALLIYGSIYMSFGFAHITATFAAMTFCTGIAYGMSINEVCSSMARGMSAIFIVILVVLLARATLYVMEYTKTIDTIIMYLSQFVEGIPFIATSILFVVQTFINLIIPSGAGQALITMPMIVPLADMGGIPRQVAALASQFGDGYSNFLWPTNGSLLVVLAISGIPYSRWIKFFLPLFFIISAVSFGFLWIALTINLA